MLANKIIAKLYMYACTKRSKIDYRVENADKSGCEQGLLHELQVLASTTSYNE